MDELYGLIANSMKTEAQSQRAIELLKLRDAEIAELKSADLNSAHERIKDLDVLNGQLKTEKEILRQSLAVAANRLRGVSLAIKTHGQNINTEFFITEYKAFADEALADAQKVEPQPDNRDRVIEILKSALKDACSCSRLHAGWCPQCKALADADKISTYKEGKNE